MELVVPQVNWTVLAPLLAVILTALTVLVADLFIPKEKRGALASLSLLGLLVAFILCWKLWGREERAFREMVALDRLALFFDALFILTAFLTILISTSYLKREEAHYGEYYALLLFATSGMMIMAAGLDLIILFLGLETLSISLFVLAGFLRGRLNSNESALKYLLLGAFATSFFLYGIALVYGATGTTSLLRIAEAFEGNRAGNGPLLLIGVGLLLVGLGFKMGTVPFHAWLPDVYEGAPTSVTAFMIASTKAATLAAFLRVFSLAFSTLEPNWSKIVWLLAILTMTVGNVIALAQQSVKRMLAYSSIAHAGYLLVALVAGDRGAFSILFYLLAYAFMNLGAFGVLVALTRKGEESFDFSEYAGLGFRYPLLSLCMAIFMLSLAGFPPTAGFVGKFYIFSAAVEKGYIGLAIVGVLNSVLSVYFYLRVIVVMYMSEAKPEPAPLTLSPALGLAILVSALMTLELGLFPGMFLELARLSILALGG